MIAKIGSGWWADFFSGLCLDYVQDARDEEQTRAELGFIQAAMGLPTRARVLDLPCGAGRLALEMAACGYRVTGIDQSGALIASANREAIERGLDLDLRQGDMRRLPEDGSYDGAVCFWNSFGYFDDAGNLAVPAGGIAEPAARRAAGAGYASAGNAAMLDAVQEPRVWERAGRVGGSGRACL